MDRIFRVTYRHWKDTDRLLTISGDMPDDINNDASDFIFVKRHDGLIMDIRRESVVSVEQIKPKP